jgi:dipeptidyl aminopeptidase/acylaminoacyl peptidase
MTRIRALGLALVLVLVANVAAAAPLEAYGRLPSIEQAVVSPDGEQLAVIVTNGEERRIVVKDLVQGKITLLATVGHAKTRDLRWVGEEHLILTSGRTSANQFFPTERFVASDIDLRSKTLRPLFRDPGARSFELLAGLPMIRWIGAQPHVFFNGLVKEASTHPRISLYEVDLSTDTTRTAISGEPNTYQFVVGPSGQALAEALYDRLKGKWTLKLNTGTGWREVLARQAFLDAPQVLGLSHDGRAIVVDVDPATGTQWCEISLVTMQPGSCDKVVDGQWPIDDPVTDRMIGIGANIGDELRYTFFDAHDQEVWDAVRKAFDGDRVTLVSWSNDRSKILVRVDSATDGPAYSIVDLATRRAKWLGNEYESLKPNDISAVSPLSFNATDGLRLNGYLTTPHGVSRRPLPLVVLVDDMPGGRDTLGFNWLGQGIASRGYAVLQVNFRGSGGYGPDFRSAGYGQWGRKMQSDLSDGVRHLASEGLIDPKRVCIVGYGLYGGYAALAGAAFEKRVYRCAVSYAGVSNLQQIGSRLRGMSAEHYWDRSLGAENSRAQVFAAYSPALHASDVTAPILLIHPKDDAVVPLEQSENMAAALKRAGKSVELVVQANADHWLSLGDARLAMLKATMAFVEKNNPPN